MSRARSAEGMRAKPGPLTGRGQERALLHGFLSSVVSTGSSLVLIGQAGVGKTALLDEAASLAQETGLAVLRATAVEFAPADRFAVLAGLLRPLLRDLRRLDPPARGALEVALGLRPGPPTHGKQLPAA